MLLVVVARTPLSSINNMYAGEQAQIVPRLQARSDDDDDHDQQEDVDRRRQQQQQQVRRVSQAQERRVHVVDYVEC